MGMSKGQLIAAMAQLRERGRQLKAADEALPAVRPQESRQVRRARERAEAKRNASDLKAYKIVERETVKRMEK